MHNLFKYENWQKIVLEDMFCIRICSDCNDFWKFVFHEVV